MKRLRIGFELVAALVLLDIGFTASKNTIHAPILDVVIIDLVAVALVALLIWDAWRVSRKMRSTESPAPPA
jgi:hypothetical protein